MKSIRRWGWAALGGILGVGIMAATAAAAEPEAAELPENVYAAVVWEKPPASLRHTPAMEREFLRDLPMALRLSQGVIDEFLDIDKEYDRLLPLLAKDRPVGGVFAVPPGRGDDGEFALLVVFAPGVAARLGNAPATLGENTPFPWRWTPAPDGPTGRLAPTAGDDDDTLEAAKLAGDWWLLTEDRKDLRPMVEAARGWIPAVAGDDSSAAGGRVRIRFEPAKAIRLFGREADGEIEDWLEDVAKYSPAPLPAGYLPLLREPARATAQQAQAATAAAGKRSKRERVAEARGFLEQVASWRLDLAIADEGGTTINEYLDAVPGTTLAAYRSLPRPEAAAP